MYFFPSEDSHPLGSKWILSPEPYHLSGLNSEARYIGYSIEDACLPLDVVPMDERENRAYILAKVRAIPSFPLPLLRILNLKLKNLALPHLRTVPRLLHQLKSVSFFPPFASLPFRFSLHRLTLNTLPRPVSTAPSHPTPFPS
jgi:hypothetical protein